MVYCGCQGCCARSTWCLSITLLLAGVAGLAAGLVRVVPCATTLSTCLKEKPALSDECWNSFWGCTASGAVKGLFFWLALAGLACAVLSLLMCTGFCCAKSPAARRRKQEQFMAGGPTDAPTTQTATPGDTAVYSDQYAAYDQYPNVKPSVAHV